MDDEFRQFWESMQADTRTNEYHHLVPRVVQTKDDDEEIEAKVKNLNTQSRKRKWDVKFVGGSLTPAKRNGVVVGIKMKLFYENRKYYKSWSYLKFGGKEKTNLLAKKWREELSDKIGASHGCLTITESAKIALAVQQYLSSFVDGDGMIRAFKNGLAHIALVQSCDTDVPVVLIYLQKFYGGTISKAAQKEGERRTQFWLSWYGVHCIAVLNHLVKFTILKLPQAELLFNYVTKGVFFAIANGTSLERAQVEIVYDYLESYTYGKALSHARDPQEAKEIYSTLRKMKTQEAYHSVALPLDLPIRLTLAWITSFIDTEGYVNLERREDCRREYSTPHLRYTPICRIYQNSSRPLLAAINTFFKNIGNMSNPTEKNHNLTFNGKYAVNVLRVILPHSITKRRQIQIVLHYMDGNLKDAAACCMLLKRLKRM